MRTFTSNESAWECTEPIEFYGESVSLSVEVESQDGPIENQLATIDAIERVGEPLMEDICRHARNYCKKVDLAVDLESEGVHIDYEHIADHIRFKGIAVPKLGQSSAAIFFVDCDCDWEPAHGMQLIIEGDAVVFCDSYSLLYTPQWNKLIELSPEERRQELIRRMQAVQGRG